MSRPIIRRRGTTLVEVLVVIVILTVGILAIVQIFPKGFQILSQTRATSQAAALARSEAERLRNRQFGVPEAILPLNVASAGAPFIDPSLSPDDPSPVGDGIDEVGALYRGGTLVAADYRKFVGVNRFRRIVGETAIITAPRTVAAGLTGCVVPLRYGPIDETAINGGTEDGLVVRTNPLVRIGDRPSDLVPDGTLFRTGLGFGPFDFFGEDLGGTAPGIYVPAAATVQNVSIDLAVVLPDGSRRDLRGLAAQVPIRTQPTGQLGRVDLAALVVDRLGPGTYRIDPASVQPRFRFRRLGALAFPVGEPLVFFAPPGRGVIVFSPAVAGIQVSSSVGRSPLTATMDYTVADWRNLIAESRVVDLDANTLRLPLGRLLVGNERGSDGIVNGSILDGGLELPATATQVARADNFVAIDDETGGTLVEQDGATPLVFVDKSSGIVTFADADAARPDLQGRVLRVDGSIITVDLTKRPLRFVYRVKEDWAVAPMKAAARYSQVAADPGAGQFVIQGTRLFFPRCDAGARITIGTINYVDINGIARQLVGQDAVVGGTGANNVGLPFVELGGFLNGGTLSVVEPPVQGVRGSGMSVRLTRYLGATTFTTDRATNLRRLSTLLQTQQRTRSELTIETPGARL